MDILTQQKLNEEALAELLLKYAKSEKNIGTTISSLLAPMNFTCDIFNYAKLIDWLSSSSRKIVCILIKNLLEEMDRNFRYSKGRIDRYYVKNTRQRTIITMFGEVTYTRTEYIDRDTGEAFIYVDREIDLAPRQRYDSIVAARAYELYSDNNSMIKVGKLLGYEIEGFSLGNNHGNYTISRQQVFAMLNRFKKITVTPPRQKETPDTIYISADEKYISLQQVQNLWIQQEREKGRSSKEIQEELKAKHFDEMVKLAVIFTGRKELLKKNGESYKRKRYQLTGKWVVAYPDESSKFWQNAHDTLNDLYDLDQVKQIYILGDGAPWIKNGCSELASQNTKCQYAQDRYHLKQAIHRMTKDKKIREKLYDYVIHNSKKDFKELVDSMIQDSPAKAENIKAKADYILSNIGGTLIMENDVKFGCAMEQAIQHVLASSFTSVPKAYASEHLHTYVTARVNQQNGIDMQSTFLSAIKQSGKDGNTDSVVLHDSNDWSYFDDQVPEDTYHVNLPNFETTTPF